MPVRWQVCQSPLAAYKASLFLSGDISVRPLVQQGSFLFEFLKKSLFFSFLGATLLLLVLLVITPLSYGDSILSPQLEKDLLNLSNELSPIVGKVISAEKDIVIDLGTEQGITVGDLFTVYVKDGPMAPSVEKGIYRKARAGLLRVMELNTDRARCKVVVRERPIPAGATVERYSGLNAGLIAMALDESPMIAPLRSYLEEHLWWMNWVDPRMLPSSFESLKAPLDRFDIDLLLVVSHGGIDLYDATLKRIRHHALDLAGFFQRQRPASVNVRRLTASQFKRVGELDIMAQQAYIVDCNHNDIPEIYILTSGGVFVQEYGHGAGSFIDGTASTVYEKAVSFSLSCDQGLLAMNREEPGVAFHSSVVDISRDPPLSVCEDVNLWLGFYELSPMADKVLVGQVHGSSRLDEDRALLVLSSCVTAPEYSKKLRVPKEFTLNSGWLGRGYVFYLGRNGEWIMGHLGKLGVDWTRVLSWESTDGFIPRFNLASPVTIQGEPGLIVPGYKAGTSMSRLYFISLEKFTASIFSDPLDGEVIGIGLLGPRLYLVLIQEADDKTLLLEAFFHRTPGLQ